ncbi:MAG: SLC13 family permease [Anaerolineae bacterium]
MTYQIALLLFIIVISLTLFSLEQAPADIVAVGILLTLILTGLLPSNTAFSSFGSDAVIMIFGLFVLTSALVHTGVVDMVGSAILKRTGDSESGLIAMVMAISATLSALMSNTATTAFLLPVTISMARKTEIDQSKLLMPLAFSAILASSVTVVSTSTNIVISGLISRYDMRPIGMFEMTLVGIPIVLVGLAYMFFIGRHLMPEREGSEDLFEEFGIERYLTELLILPDSPLIGKTLGESALGRDLDLTVLRVVRDKQPYLPPSADLTLEEGDLLLVKGPRDEIPKIKDVTGVDIEAEVKLSLSDLQSKHTVIVEAIVLPNSPLVGRTLKQVWFRQRYRAQVLGVSRRGRRIARKISQIPFRAGDQLLIQGDRRNIARLDENNTFRMIGTVEYERPNLERAPFAIATFAGVFVAVALDILALPVAVLTGVLMALLTGCITSDEAYRGVEWKALIVIGSMLALGSAMEHTGTAELLATGIVDLIGQTHPVWLLTGFFGLSLLLTQPMSNQAAAVVVVPVAIQTASQVGLNPRTFAIMIAVGASCSYLTPLEPACLIVYGPGRYRFADFLKVGALLTVLVYILAIALVPMLWPL